MASFASERLVPAPSIGNLGCVNCSTDYLKGCTAMLSCFAFLIRHLLSVICNTFTELLTIVTGAMEGKKPHWRQVCDIQWMLLNSQIPIYMSLIHECVSNLFLPFFSQYYSSRRAHMVCSLQDPFLPHQWKGKRKAGTFNNLFQPSHMGEAGKLKASEISGAALLQMKA